VLKLLRRRVRLPGVGPPDRSPELSVLLTELSSRTMTGDGLDRGDWILVLALRHGEVVTSCWPHPTLARRIAGGRTGHIRCYWRPARRRHASSRRAIASADPPRRSAVHARKRVTDWFQRRTSCPMSTGARFACLTELYVSEVPAAQSSTSNGRAAPSPSATGSDVVRSACCSRFSCLARLRERAGSPELPGPLRRGTD
jgi:hypothetical protein